MTLRSIQGDLYNLRGHHLTTVANLQDTIKGLNELKQVTARLDLHLQNLVHLVGNMNARTNYLEACMEVMSQHLLTMNNKLLELCPSISGDDGQKIPSDVKDMINQ